MLSLLVIGMTLVFTLSEIERHRRVLSRRIPPLPHLQWLLEERGVVEKTNTENIEKSIAISQLSVNHGLDHENSCGDSEK